MGVQCHPRIVFQQDAAVTLIGYPFFENFVVSYDYAHGSINFGVNDLAFTGAAMNDPTSPIPGPSPSGDPTDPHPTPTPTPDDPDHEYRPGTENSTWITIGIIAVAVIVLGILAIITI